MVQKNTQHTHSYHVEIQFEKKNNFLKHIISLKDNYKTIEILQKKIIRI